jgi:CMP-2-keto-3-deoxyoctulosonic acid synthetase
MYGLIPCRLSFFRSKQKVLLEVDGHPSIIRIFKRTMTSKINLLFAKYGRTVKNFYKRNIILNFTQIKKFI